MYFGFYKYIEGDLIMNKVRPYVYKITQKLTGEYYFGAKYSKYNSIPEKF
jgi:hypothetical protein